MQMIKNINMNNFMKDLNNIINYNFGGAIQV